MANTRLYIVRIELHGPNCDYSELHAWMDAAGFKRELTGDAGATSKLPTATYACEVDMNAVELRDWLMAHMPTCGSDPEPWILATEAPGWAMYSQAA